MGQGSSEAFVSLPAMLRRPDFPDAVRMAVTGVHLDSSSRGHGATEVWQDMGSGPWVVLSSPLAKTPSQSPQHPKWGCSPRGTRGELGEEPAS